MTTKNLERLAWALGAVVAVMTAFLVITSCNSEAIYDPAVGKNADLVIDASIEGATSETKASTNLHESAFVANDAIQVYMWNTTNTSSVTELVNKTLTYNGTSWSPSSIAAAIPATCTSGQVLGVYPTGKLNVTAANRTSSFTYTVGDAQHEDAVYNAADLMLAYATPNYNSTTAALTFKHVMSKLIFNFQSTSGTALSVGRVDLYCVCDEATVSNLMSTTPTATAVAGGNVDFCIQYETTASSTAVILPPQKVGASTYSSSGANVAIEVEYNDALYIGTLPNVTMKGGYVYKFTVKLQNASKSLSISAPTITSWGTETGNTGGNVTAIEE